GTIREPLVLEQRFVNAFAQRSLGVGSSDRLRTLAGTAIYVGASCAAHQSQRRGLREHHSIRQVLWRNGMAEATRVKAPDPLRFGLNCLSIGNLDSVAAVADGTLAEFVRRFLERAGSMVLRHDVILSRLVTSR